MGKKNGVKTLLVSCYMISESTEVIKSNYLAHNVFHPFLLSLKLESSIQYHSENKCDFYANSQIQGEKPQIWWQRKSIVPILDGCCGCIQFSHFGGHCKRMSPKRLLCGDESRCTKEGKVGRWICVNRGGVELKWSVAKFKYYAYSTSTHFMT